jgi:hypothetical protein
MKDVLLANLVRSINQLLLYFTWCWFQYISLLFTSPVGNSPNGPVLFADDTTLIVTHSNHIDFNTEITSVFTQLNEWCAAKLLSLHFKKAQYMQFMIKNTSVDKISIGYICTFI